MGLVFESFQIACHIGRKGDIPTYKIRALLYCIAGVIAV